MMVVVIVVFVLFYSSSSIISCTTQMTDPNSDVKQKSCFASRTPQTKPNKETVGLVIVAAGRLEPGLNVLFSRDGLRERMQLRGNAKVVLSLRTATKPARSKIWARGRMLAVVAKKGIIKVWTHPSSLLW
jgi:hypothetical protein